MENVGGRVSVVLGRPLRFRGAHAKGANFDSIGVCAVGNFNTAAFEDDTSNVLASLLADLCAVFGLSELAIVPHQRAGVTSTECPGDHVMQAWDALMEEVRDLL